MDIVVKFLLDTIPDPRIFPFFMLGFGWVIWLILKVCQWPRPRVSTMLLYSVSVAIAFDLQLPMVWSCLFFADTCSSYFYLWQRFFFDVVFWFIIIYIVMKFALRINRNRHGNSEA